MASSAKAVAHAIETQLLVGRRDHRLEWLGGCDSIDAASASAEASRSESARGSAGGDAKQWLALVSADQTLPPIFPTSATAEGEGEREWAVWLCETVAEDGTSSPTKSDTQAPSHVQVRSVATWPIYEGAHVTVESSTGAATCSLSSALPRLQEGLSTTDALLADLRLELARDVGQAQSQDLQALAHRAASDARELKLSAQSVAFGWSELRGPFATHAVIAALTKGTMSDGGSTSGASTASLSDVSSSDGDSDEATAVASAVDDLDLEPGSKLERRRNPFVETVRSPRRPTLSKRRSTTFRAAHEHARVKERYVHRKLHQRRSDFTTRHTCTVRCSTWNLANAELDADVGELLGLDGAAASGAGEEPGIIACAFQECDLSTEAFLSSYTARAQRVTDKCTRALGDHYELVGAQQLVGILLAVWVHKSLAPAVSSVEQSFVSLGVFGMLGNKGACGVRFRLFDTTFAFAGAHLAAGQAEVAKRNADLRECQRRLFNERGIWDWGFGGPMPTPADAARFRTPDQIRRSGVEGNLFLMGDLNYRIELSRDAADVAVGRKDWHTLLECDQLTRARRHTQPGTPGSKNSDSSTDDLQLDGFHEADIDFAPTYKLDRGTIATYDTSEKQRVPSYTDRILYRTTLGAVSAGGGGKSSSEGDGGDGDGGEKAIDCIDYRSHPTYTISDHKPVSCTLTCTYDVVEHSRRDEVKAEALKQLDRYENEARPKVKLITRTGATNAADGDGDGVGGQEPVEEDDFAEVQFGTVRPFETAERSFIVRNEGPTLCSFKVESSRAWLSCQPSHGVIEPYGGEIACRCVVRIDAADCAELHSMATSGGRSDATDAGVAELSEILVVKVLGGIDAYLPVSLAWQTAAPFGTTIERLAKRDKEGVGSTMPDCVLECCDYISKHAAELTGMPLSADDLRALCSASDMLMGKETTDLDQIDGLSADVVTTLLLLMLETLAEPIVQAATPPPTARGSGASPTTSTRSRASSREVAPAWASVSSLTPSYRVSSRSASAASSKASPVGVQSFEQALEALERLPPAKANVLIYLTSWLRTLDLSAANDGEQAAAERKSQLVAAFAAALAGTRPGAEGGGSAESTRFVGLLVAG